MVGADIPCGTVPRRDAELLAPIGDRALLILVFAELAHEALFGQVPVELAAKELGTGACRPGRWRRRCSNGLVPYGLDAPCVHPHLRCGALARSEEVLALMLRHACRSPPGDAVRTSTARPVHEPLALPELVSLEAPLSAELLAGRHDLGAEGRVGVLQRRLDVVQ